MFKCCDGFINACKKCYGWFQKVTPFLPVADFITDIYTVHRWWTLCRETETLSCTCTSVDATSVIHIVKDCLWWKLGKFNVMYHPNCTDFIDI